MSEKSFTRSLFKGLGILILILAVLGAGAYFYIKSEMPSHSVPTTPIAQVKSSESPTLYSIRKGLAYLRVYQEDDGHFVAGKFSPKPAITSMVVEAFLRSPEGYSIKKDAFLKKAVDAIVSEQKESGSIHTEIPGGMSYSSYSTSVSLMALTSIKDSQYAPVIAKAVAYLKSGQQPAGNVNEGGFGYGNGSRADLNNSCMILGALEEAGISKDDPVWKNAVTYIQHCQNRSESNDQEWAEDDGGFIYCPNGLKKGAVGRDGRPANASYGTMSYSGLISFLYADVDKSDPRVQSAYAWIQKHYNLTDNPGKGQGGLYYYYRIMSKALARYGEKTITTPDGVKHDWAKELAEQLIRLQKPDGSWVNSNKAFMENDPIMVTSYAVRTLSTCYEQMKKNGSATTK